MLQLKTHLTKERPLNSPQKTADIVINASNAQVFCVNLSQLSAIHKLDTCLLFFQFTFTNHMRSPMQQHRLGIERITGGHVKLSRGCGTEGLRTPMPLM